MLFTLSLLSLSCTNEFDSSLSQSDSNQLLKSEQINPDSANVVAMAAGICPDGYVPVWTWEFPTPFAYRVKECRGGFGFCIGLKGGATFDCVKIDKLQEYKDTSLKKSNFANGIMVPVLVVLDSKTMRLYVSKDVDTSLSHVPSDFNLLEIGDLEVDDNYILKAGNYIKQVDSDSYYYDIPYTYIP